MANLTNFVRARLTNAINVGSTSITVKYTASNYYKAPPDPNGTVTTLKLVDSPDNPQNVEIITYAGRTGTTPNFTLTGVVRGVSGTTAKKWRGGCFVESVADADVVNAYAVYIVTTVTSATIVSLTSASAGIQEFIGTLDQIVVLPDTSTLTAGKSFKFINNSTGVVTLKDSDNVTLTILQADTNATVTCLSVTIQTWEVENVEAKDILTSTATANTTTTLTLLSTGIQEFTGTANQIVTLPDTSTLTAGKSFKFINNSTGVVTLKDSTGITTLTTLQADINATVTCLSIVTQSWEVENVVNIVTAWQTTPDDVHVPSEKLVKDILDLKLNASAYIQHYRGKFTTLAALTVAIPTANDGDYAQVDVGIGGNVVNYNWDAEAGWVIGSSGSGATDTDMLIEGSTNLYFTAARVRDTVLTGLSLATSQVIAATDTILLAFGYLQAQITALATATLTFTNKRITYRVGTVLSTATPSIDCGLYDYYNITALEVAIAGVTITGIPTDGQCLIVRITGTAARAIIWGSSFEASTVALPTTTVTTATLVVGFIYSTTRSKWVCIGVS